MKNVFYIILVVLLIISCKQKTEIKKETSSPKIAIDATNGLFSVLVAKNDTIIFKNYYEGKKSNDFCDVQSVTKSIMSVLVGIAIDKGYIESENEPIKNYFPEEFARLNDKRKDSITIKDLLNQTSGLVWKGYLEHENWLKSDNPIAFVLEKPLEAKPSAKYNYNSGATHLLSVILTKATKKSTLDFAKEALFNPLKIDSVQWKKRGKGFYDGSGLGLAMKSKDLLSIGKLLLNKGKIDDKTLVSEQWVNKMFDDSKKLRTDWGLPNSKHGYCFYKASFKENNIDYAMGYGGQFILLIQEKNMVIVTTHNHDTPNGIKQQIQFLNKNLPKLLEL